MTWLAFRRHRTNLIVATGLAITLVLWMAWVVHGLENTPFVRYRSLGFPGQPFRDYYRGLWILQLPHQVDALNYLLLTFPCALGGLFGVPLVAAELEDRTNRLAWSQSISRTRWLLTKWWVVGIPILVLTVLVALVTQWWQHQVGTVGIVSIFGPVDFGGTGRMQPQAFSVTGIAPIAYTFFAFSLGTAVGATLHRVSWSIVATIVVYGIALAVMVTTVRPNLAPKSFVAYSTFAAGVSAPSTHSDGEPPWLLGSDYRFVPGSHHPLNSSAVAVGRTCENQQLAQVTCLALKDVQTGQIFQPASNYWTLQWKESAIYVIASAFLLALGLWLVRRWRA
jgi:hypothetical protein